MSLPVFRMPDAFQLRQPHHLRHWIPAWIELEHPALAEVRGTAHILGVQQSQVPVGLHVRADVDRLSEIDHPGAIGPNTSTLIRPDDGLHRNLCARRQLQVITDGSSHCCLGVPRNPTRIAPLEVAHWAAEHNTPQGEVTVRNRAPTTGDRAAYADESSVRRLSIGTSPEPARCRHSARDAPRKGECTHAGRTRCQEQVSGPPTDFHEWLGLDNARARVVGSGKPGSNNVRKITIDNGIDRLASPANPISAAPPYFQPGQIATILAVGGDPLSC